MKLFTMNAAILSALIPASTALAGDDVLGAVTTFQSYSGVAQKCL